MSTSFSINLKMTKGKNKKKKHSCNVFGERSETTSVNHSKDEMEQLTNARKRRKIKLTEINQDDILSKQPEKDELIISLNDNENERTSQEITTHEDYNAVPVDQFAEAILRGMGWDGKTDESSNSSKDNDVSKSIHADGLGIGAKGNAPVTNLESFMPVIKVTKVDLDK